VLIVEDEPYMAEAIRDGLRLEAIAADVAGDGDTALELLRVNAYVLFCSARLAPERTCGGYGAVYGAFRFEVLAVHVAARLARSALTAPSRARTARLGSVAIRSHRNRVEGSTSSNATI
jgi:hypothetical protein